MSREEFLIESVESFFELIDLMIASPLSTEEKVRLRKHVAELKINFEKVIGRKIV